MEEVLGKSEKIIFDSKNNNVLPLLQLNDNKNFDKLRKGEYVHEKLLQPQTKGEKYAK